MVLWGSIGWKGQGGVAGRVGWLASGGSRQGRIAGRVGVLTQLEGNESSELRMFGSEHSYIGFT